MMHEKNKACCGRFLLRLTLGILFSGAGLMKIMDPSVIIGMLGQIGFPTPAFFGWLLMLSEILFGIAVLIGFRVKYTVWPLIIVLVVAALTVYLPTLLSEFGKNFGNFMFHLIGITALITIGLSGPGDFAVSKE